MLVQDSHLDVIFLDFGVQNGGQKLLRSIMRPTFGAPSAYLEPSWLQVGFVIDFKGVLASLGSLLGLSWEGVGPILASSRAYLDPP